MDQRPAGGLIPEIGQSGGFRPVGDQRDIGRGTDYFGRLVASQDSVEKQRMIRVCLWCVSSFLGGIAVAAAVLAHLS